MVCSSSIISATIYHLIQFLVNLCKSTLICLETFHLPAINVWFAEYFTVNFMFLIWCCTASLIILSYKSSYRFYRRWLHTLYTVRYVATVMFYATCRASHPIHPFTALLNSRPKLKFICFIQHSCLMQSWTPLTAFSSVSGIIPILFDPLVYVPLCIILNNPLLPSVCNHHKPEHVLWPWHVHLICALYFLQNSIFGQHSFPYSFCKTSTYW